MAFDAGRFRHRIEIQKLTLGIVDGRILLENGNNLAQEQSGLILTENSSVIVQGADGELIQNWVEVAKVWAAIEPLSAREFVAASSEQAKVSTRITIRAREGLDESMRIYHKGKYYNIHGILPDKESGLDYITLPCSEGVRGEDSQA